MLPEAFIAQLQELLPDEWAELRDAIEGSEPSVSVRVNVRRGAAVPPGSERVPWCADAFYCTQRPAFTFDPDLHSGRYYVQDASSMFIHHVLRHLAGSEPVCCLDLCAAPGGKTTAALDALPAGSLVVANEIVPQRARVLADNVVRWGNPCAVVTSAAPKAFAPLTGAFHIVAADVPCSGEGMMRKDDEAARQWTPALVEECAARQRPIVADVWNALRPGGLFVYSTCTYNRQENELMVEHIAATFGAEPVAVDIDTAWGIQPAIGSALPAYRFMPHRTRGEGLFMAVLRKPADHSPAAHGRQPDPGKPGGRARRTPPGSTTAQATAASAAQWLDCPDLYAVIQQGDLVQAVPRQWLPLVQQLRAATTVLHSGIALATARGHKLIPDHCLALSSARRGDAFAQCDVDYPTALRYLRGEAIAVDAPRGHVLITHRGAPLGWVNNLGNRANNLYPKPLRILSTHTPTTQPTVL